MMFRLLCQVDFTLLAATHTSLGHWSPFLGTSSLLLVYYLVSWMRVAWCTADWNAVPLPSGQNKWLFRLLPKRFLAMQCPLISSCYASVRQSWWFRKKLALSVLLLRADILVDPLCDLSDNLRILTREVARELDEILCNAVYARLCSMPPVGGYASWRDGMNGLALLGLEKWVACSPFLGRSALAHELVHCVQQVCDRVFDTEWGAKGMSRRQALFYELHAHLTGSPLWLTLVVSFFLSTIIPLLTGMGELF